MNLRVILRRSEVLLLVIVPLFICTDYAFASQPWKGAKPVQELDVTMISQEPCDTTVETLYAATAVAYYWQQPPLRPFLSERYEIPSDHGGSLEYIQFGVYENATSGTPDPDVYVWSSDGTFPLDGNPPSQAIAEFHLDYTDIEWYPDYTTVQAYHLGTVFDPGELFHVGISHGFKLGDTLALLSDDGSIPNDRTSVWNGSAWESLAPYMFLIHVGICPFQWQSTYTMECGPALAFATPGDPQLELYHVHVGSILGYNQPVTLSLLSVDPPAEINATFTPNGDPCPYSSNVSVAVDGGVPYGDYQLTFQAVGGDGHTKICDVTLRVQPPYDDAEVDFYHGMQRASNFGALGDANSPENFLWYGSSSLFDGSFVMAGTDADHMALDVYDCEHWGWTPIEHMSLYYDPEYNANIAFGNFFSETIPGEHDSLFVVGLADECVGFSVKIKICYNPSDTAIPELYAGVFEDWDVGDYSSNWVDLDTLHNLMYMWDVADPSIVFGIMRAPFSDRLMHAMIAVYVLGEIRPNDGFCDSTAGWYGLDSLFVLMTNPHPHYRYPHPLDPHPSDFALLMVAPPFSLNPGDAHIEVWIDFGRNLNDGMTWEQWYKKILRYVGFYRGDVNASDTLELPTLDISDLVCLLNYLYRGGPAPLPFADQGNVDGKGPFGGPVDTVSPKNNVDLQDLVYLLNYVYKGGPAPVDYVRFIPSFWSRPSLFANPNWR